MMRALTVTALALGSLPASAVEYRNVTLADGRTLPAEIKGITATEMTLLTPQGTVVVSPNDLRDMQALSAEDYAALPPWKVLVLPFAGEPEFKDDRQFAHLFSLRVLESIPAVSPVAIADLPAAVSQTTKSSLRTCGTDLQCATRHGQDAGADVVVMGRVQSTNDERSLTIGAVFVDAPSARRRTSIPYNESLIERRREITNGLYESLFLAAPDDAEIPTVVLNAKPAPAAGTEPVSLNRLAWAPLPGVTAYKSDNMAGFASALGIVAVGTGASVYIAGHATYSAPQMVAMSALTSYGLTVFVNHLFVKN